MADVTQVVLPNDGKTDRKVKFTLLGGALGSAGVGTLGLPEKAQKMTEALLSGVDPSVGDFVGTIVYLAVLLGAQLGAGWVTGYMTKKGLYDG